MSTQHPQKTPGVSRRTLLQAGLAAGVTLSAWPLAQPPLCGCRSGTAQARRHPAHTWVGSPLRFPSHDQQLHELHVELRLRPAGPAQNRRGRAARPFIGRSGPNAGKSRTTRRWSSISARG